MNIGKPVKEEVSASATMPSVDSDAVDAGPYCSGADRDSTVRRTWTTATFRTETDFHQSPRLVPWAASEAMPPWDRGRLKLAHTTSERRQPDGNLRFVLAVEHAPALVAPAAAAAVAAAASSAGLGCLFLAILARSTADEEAGGNSPSVMPKRLEIEGSDGLIVSSPGGDGGDWGAEVR